MKKLYIYVAVVFAAISVVDAQNRDFDTFCKEMKGLESDGVTYEELDLKTCIKSLFFSQLNEQLGENAAKKALEPVFNGDGNKRLIVLSSTDKTGYRRICSFVEKYEIETAEEFFGVPLAINSRENGITAMIFSNDDMTFILTDNTIDSCYEFIFAECNVLEYLQKAMISVVKTLGEDEFDVVNILGNEDISFSVKINGDENSMLNEIASSFVRHKASILEAYNEKMTALQLQKTEDNKEGWAAIDEQMEEFKGNLDDVLEEFDEVMIDYLDLMNYCAENYIAAKAANVYADVADIYNVFGKAPSSANKGRGAIESDSINAPSFVKRGDEWCVAIPALNDDLKKARKSYALNGIYDWINETGFCKGATENPHQKSEIITPQSLLEKYLAEYPSTEIKYSFSHSSSHPATEYQGGVPAVLYRKSLSAEGYKDMLRDLEPFFALKMGDRYNNMKVTNRFDYPDGKRFVQLYGDRGVFMCVYDSPADYDCSMSITVGTDDDFTAIVNSYGFDDESTLADKFKIVIGDKGVKFIEKTTSNKESGVCFDFEYYKLTN